MTQPTPLEAELRSRHAVREERFTHGAFDVSVLLPRAAEELIDPAEFDADERLPYWADLWPSARALARFLLDRREPPAGRAVELGCGVALPSLALRSIGASVVATDYYDEALRFAEANAERNGIPPLPTMNLDWRRPPEAEPYDLVLAADVLYERRNAEALRDLLPRITRAGGEVLLADPGRVYLGEFRDMMLERGWIVESAAVRDEHTPSEGKVLTSKVGILRLCPPRRG
ncbi:MAG: Methyltransferase type 12 [Gemmatimonadetes bacterium]|nr:Methyltransferase type 12 [Gemmatimonadota bacterium]